MNERERLAELIHKAELAMWGKPVGDAKSQREFIADYLLNHGIIAPPCKVGDVVWMVRNFQIERWKVVDIVKAASYMKLGIKFIARGVRSAPVLINTSCIGEIVFLTREEAEAALAERRKA